MPWEHRKQRWWYILLPMLIAFALAVALAVVIVRSPDGTVAQASALVVACVAGFLIALAMPLLVVLVWVVWHWSRVYRAVSRYAARVLQAQERFRQQVLRLSDAAARLVIAPRVRWAQARALVARLTTAVRGARRLTKRKSP